MVNIVVLFLGLTCLSVYSEETKIPILESKTVFIKPMITLDNPELIKQGIIPEDSKRYILKIIFEF